MSVEILGAGNEWTTFLKDRPNATFYHSLKWKDVIQKTFRYSPLYLLIRDDLGKIAGICPGFIKSSLSIKMFDSMPYSDYGGPIIENHYKRRGSLLLRSFLQEFCPNDNIEYAKFCFLEESGLSRFYKSPSTYVERVKGVVEIDLRATSSDFLWNKVYSHQLRKVLRRFEREGYQVYEAQTKSGLLEFYDSYLQTMKHIGGSPDPYRLVENMWNVLYPGNLRLWILRRGGIIGSEFFLQTEEGSYARYLTVDRKQTGTHLSPSTYLRWIEIKRAEQEGKRYVSFGSTPFNPNDQHYLQKRRIGGSFHPQEMIWYPLTSTGCTLIQARAKTTQTWKAIRGFFPVVLKSYLERKLLRL